MVSLDEDKPRPKPDRLRPRIGAVQVELTPEERAALEGLRNRMAVATGQRGTRIGLAGVFRWLLHQELERGSR